MLFRSIVDLPNANILQSMFLKSQNINCNLCSCFELDKLSSYDLVISNYCLAELSLQNRKEYLNKIDVNCNKEFYIWNSDSLEGLNLDIYNIEIERPQTNKRGYNKFIYSK